MLESGFFVTQVPGYVYDAHCSICGDDCTPGDIVIVNGEKEIACTDCAVRIGILLPDFLRYVEEYIAVYPKPLALRN